MKNTKSKILIFGIVLGLILSFGAGSIAQANDNDNNENPENKVTICHATHSETNPYVRITISESALSAHNVHQDHEDIIPMPEEGCPGENEPASQCSDNVDNNDPEDTLIDELDPGCHTDGNAGNESSYNANDDDETDPVPENSAPTANAGPDQIITLPTDSTNLNGSGTDSDGTIASYVWTQVSGPVLNPDDVEDPSISGLVAGTYVFKLTVTDNDGATDDDTVQITVNPEVVGVPECSDNVDNNDAEDTLADELDPGCHTDGNAGNESSYNANDDDETDPVPENSAPTANAGPDQIITLPTNSVNLDGSGSADSDGTIASYTWEFVSGPSNVNPSDVVTPSAGGLVAGAYVFKLVVTDNDGATDDDTVSVTVNPEVAGTPECSDNVDNNDTEDTLADELDPGCHTDGNEGNSGSYNQNDNNETDVPECSDTGDNDSDQLVDSADPGCHTDGNEGNTGSYNPNDDNETDVPECSNTGDDDADQLVDSADPGCHTDGNAGNSNSYDPNDNNETNTNGGGGNDAECEDNVDNNDTEDTLADELDPGCHTDGNAGNSNSYDSNDNDEHNVGNTECSDEVDNDDDTRIDSTDPGCHSDEDVENPASYVPSDDSEDNSGGEDNDTDNSNRSRSGGSSRRVVSTPTPAPVGQVLAAQTSCGIYVEKYLRVGYANNVETVKKVQSFLNGYMNSGLVLDGIYGVKTEAAVRSFQLKHADKILTPWGISVPTGIFYLTTQTEVNNIMCPPLNLPIPSNLINWSASNLV